MGGSCLYEKKRVLFTLICFFIWKQKSLSLGVTCYPAGRKVETPLLAMFSQTPLISQPVEPSLVDFHIPVFNRSACAGEGGGTTGLYFFSRVAPLLPYLCEKVGAFLESRPLHDLKPSRIVRSALPRFQRGARMSGWSRQKQTLWCPAA